MGEYNNTIKNLKDYVLLQPKMICDKDVRSDLIAFFNYKVLTDRLMKMQKAENKRDSAINPTSDTAPDQTGQSNFIITKKGDFTVVISKDCEGKPGWDDELIELMKQDSSIAVAVPKIIGPRHLLYSAGGEISVDGKFLNRGYGDNYDIACYNYVMECDFAPKTAYVKRDGGSRIMYDPFSIVYSRKAISEIVTDYLQPAQSQESKSNEDKPKTMLMLDFRIPRFDTDAGGRLTYAYIKLYTEMGIKVTLFVDNCYKSEPYATGLNKMGVEVLYGPQYYGNRELYLEKNLGRFDYVFVQRPHIWVKYEELILKYSKGKVIYLDHDLHHVREMREYEITGDISHKEEAEKWKDIEYGIFKKCDVGYVVGSYEEELIKAALPDVTVRSIPCQVYENEPKPAPKNWNDRKGLLFVGGFTHHPNEDGVLWFAENVYPKILERFPDMVWHVAGSSVTEKITALASSNIIIDGFVSDERLNELYDSSRIVVVPLRYGAGVKGKVLEACHNAVPLVTTSIGAEGLPLEGVCAIKNDAAEMAASIISLYEDYNELTAMSERERQFIIENSMPDSALKIITMDI